MQSVKKLHLEIRGVFRTPKTPLATGLTKVDKGIDNLNIMSKYRHLGWGACVVMKNL